VNILENEVNEQREKFKSLEDSMSNGEKSLKKKVSQLEKNVEDLTMMYHQVIVNINASKMNSQVYT
jgi:archaellum component FlaC